MKKLIFTSVIILTCVSFYVVKPFFFKKISKNPPSLVKQKKLQHYRFTFLKRFYTRKIKTINPLTFLRKRLRKLWVDHTYRYVDLSKANKLIEPKVSIAETPIVAGQEKQKMIAEITEKLEGFYKNHFLEILITDGPVATIERVGNMRSILIEGKYLVREEQPENKPLLDAIIIQNVSEDILERSVLRITYDTTPHEDVEKNITKYLTRELKNTFDNIFKSTRNKKKLKKCLYEFFVEISENGEKIVKYGNHRIKFFELLTKLRKNKLVSNLNSKDEIIALRIMLQSFAFMFKTVHIQIIPQTSAEIPTKDIHHLEKNIGEKIKKTVDIIDEMIQVSRRA